MGHKVLFRPPARKDLRHLYDYIERDSPANATRYVDQIEAYYMTLAEFPERGMRRDDLRNGIRIIGFRRRVHISFTITSEGVEIVRILYGGRDLGHAFDEGGV